MQPSRVAAPPRPHADGVLERTLALTPAPGSNRRGDVLGGAWVLLLDDLELDHVACLGEPGERTLRMLARRARDVTVVCAGRRARRRVARMALSNVTGIAPAGATGLRPPDVAVVCGRRWAERAARDRVLREWLERAGTVFAPPAASLPAGRPAQRLWLGTSGGEVHAVAAVDDAAAIAFLRRPPAQATPGRAGVERLRRARRGLRESEAVLSVAAGRPAGAPPAYVRALAAAAGEPLDGFRLALAAPSDYPSRKAVMALFAPAAAAPRYIVKLTRDPAFNDRLENEDRVLRALAAAGIGDDGTVPRAVFAGRHAGLALLGQTAIAGIPFRHRTTFAHDCPAVRAGTEWLMDLGERTAELADPAAVAAALRTLLERYTDLYRPPAAEHDALARHVEAVAASTEPFPIVFQHGDPGTWNLLIGDDERPALLDWEAAEPRGMPMWDLFYFARSVGVGAGRAAGARRALDAFATQYLADTPLARVLADDVARHCASIRLDPALVAPLFFTCWMHRAVKEAARLAPDRLGRGRYVALLRLCLERPDAPGLARILRNPAV